MPLSVRAQFQTSHWTTTDAFATNRAMVQHIDVSAHPPRTINHSVTTGLSYSYNSITDELGNILFFTNGSLVYDKNGTLIGKSGEEYSWDSDVFIVPFPGRLNTFNVFFVGNDSSRGDGDVLFHFTVDLNKTQQVASPRSIILEKDGRIGNLRIGAITKTSDCQSYWLVVDNFGICSFYIDWRGVHKTPVCSDLAAALDMRMAPDGKTLAYFAGVNSIWFLIIADFDEITGKFIIRLRKDLRGFGSYQFNSFYNYLEFSPDSQNIFAVLQNETDFKLLAYKAQSHALEDFNQSEIKLVEQTTEDVYLGMQQTPTGRIYIGFQAAQVNGGYLSSISNPNAIHQEDFLLESKIATGLLFPRAPQFPVYYFQDTNNLLTQFPLNVGNDTLICRGQNITLGINLHEDYDYEWLSTGTLSSADTRTPVLVGQPLEPNVSYDTIYNYVMAYDGQCNYGVDTMRVFYPPVYAATIQGSKSVCPGVTNVSYWLEGNVSNAANIFWKISGGELSEVFHDSISVNWGATNPSAQVIATANSYGCPDLIDTLAVKVYKLLDTEKPSGPDTLMCRVDTYDYGIQGTNGSIYNWSTINGQVNQGNGTNRVSIIWDINQRYGSVWINESVNTELETCFGKSDTLNIVNPLVFGSESTHLYAISSDVHDPTKVSIHYKIQNQIFFKPTSEIFWKPQTSVAWELPFIVNNNESFYLHEFSKDVDDEYYFQLVTQNICDVEVRSPVNSNIFLTLQKDVINETLVLSWNKPAGWEGVDSYQIYKSTDDGEFALYDNVSGNTQQKSIANTLDGFYFQYYVTGYSGTDSPVLSVSNTTEVAFEHTPFVPNVITPNGDGLNDYLVIEKLHLYPNNNLAIYNRHGKKVFEETNYQNRWNGEGLPSGVYYFSLNTYRNSEGLKGWIQIVY